MNSVEKFLQELLSSQELSPEQEQALQSHKKEVTDFVRDEFGNEPVIKFAGSHEKGTMNCDDYDLDIVCYSPYSDTRSLREIRDDVSVHLSKKYILEHKASAERITNFKGASAPSTYHIDVVPGRFIEGTSDVFLHVAYGDKERMQTNLKTHINYVVKSGCVPIIRLAKIWSCRNNVRIKTFILELFVIKALAGFQNKNNLKDAFLKVIEEFKDNFGNVELTDPANTNNVVSRSIEPSDKLKVSFAAEQTYDKINDSDNLADWQNVFHENIAKNVSWTDHTAAKVNSPAVVFSPRSPWAN
jgi:hypothetical protein